MPKCFACNSLRRSEIDRRLTGGESTRSVSKWLASLGEKVSHAALATHKSAHAARVNHEETIASERVRGQLDGAKVLERVARLAWRHAKKWQHTAPEGKEDIALLGMLLSQARGAVMDRHELLHGKRKVVSVEPVDMGDSAALEDLEREVFGGKRQGAGDSSDVAATLLPPVSAPVDS